MQSIANRRVEFMLLAILLVYSSHALPAWLLAVFQHADDGIVEHIGYWNWQAVWALVFSVMLIAHDPMGYGVRLPKVGARWPWLIVLGVVPILATWLVYPRLSTKPFSGGPVSIWLISPLAQDFLFAGYFYQKFSELFPGTVRLPGTWCHRLPLQKTIFVTAVYFALWHTPGFAAGIGWYGWFQLGYTFLGACLVGIIRQWTGSTLYITLIHMAVNYIAVNS